MNTDTLSNKKNEAAMVPETFAIRNMHEETHDCFSFELVPGDLGSFRFLPGQFNMLYVFGIGEIPISISGDPGAPGKQVHTVRMVGAISRAMRKLKNGGLLGVRGPFGTGWPVAELMGRDVLLVAGGIGLAPLRPVLYQLLANRGKYGNIALVYGTRTPEDILFKKELEQWRGRFDLQIYLTVDRASGAWKGDVGVVTKLIRKVTFRPGQTIAMICGPEIMMRFAGAELEKQGIDRQNIYLSMERNMKCAIGLCGHCQLGPAFICRDGPVFRYDQMISFLTKREI